MLKAVVLLPFLWKSMIQHIHLNFLFVQEEPPSQFFFDLGEKKPQHQQRQQGRKRHTDGDRPNYPKQPRKPRKYIYLHAFRSPRWSNGFNWTIFITLCRSIKHNSDFGNNFALLFSHYSTADRTLLVLPCESRSREALGHKHRNTCECIL